MSIATPSILEWVPAPDLTPEAINAAIAAARLPQQEVAWLLGANPSPMLKSLDLDRYPRKERLFACQCVRRVQHLLPDPAAMLPLAVAERFAEGYASDEELEVAEQSARQIFVAASQRAHSVWSLGTSAPVARSAWVQTWVASAVQNACDPVLGECPQPEALAPAGRLSTRVALVTSWAQSVAQDITAGREEEPITETVLFFAFLRGLKNAAQNIERATADGDQTCEAVQQAHLLREMFGNPFRSVPFDASWRTPLICATAATIYEERDWGAMPMLGDLLEQAGCPNGSPLLRHCHGPCTHVRGCWALDLVLDR